MGDNRNTCLGERLHNLSYVGTALDLDRIRSTFANDPARTLNSVRRRRV